MISTDDVFEFMGISLEKRKSKIQFFENLIEEATAWIQEEADISISKVDFTDKYLTIENSYISEDEIYLRGELFDTISISELTENGKILNPYQDGFVKTPEYVFVKEQKKLRRIGYGWSQIDFSIKISGSKGYTSEDGTIDPVIKKILIEKIAVDSKMWTRLISSDQGDVNVLVAELSDDTKNMIKKIAMRKIY